VRVALDPREIAEHPLQIGLSMRADVDVRDGSGARLPQLTSTATPWSTEVFGSSDAQADARVAAIITANEPAAARAVATPPGSPRATGLLADAQPISVGGAVHVKAP
jgi:membrane fusion protein (multidrug efflux system)